LISKKVPFFGLGSWCVRSENVKLILHFVRLLNALYIYEILTFLKSLFMKS